jgi:uncharacterized repeat protein (TIGR01451 family)
MKLLTRTILSAVIALALLSGWVTPAFADPVIRSVTPAAILNDQANTLTIIGQEFDETAVVILNGYGALTTAFLNAQTLTATVPAGLAPRKYAVRVSMTGWPAMTWSGRLSVSAPEATPTPLPFGRPQLVVNSYKSNDELVTAGDEFRLRVNFTNEGNSTAFNVQAAFSSQDLIPQDTGGVVALGTVAAGKTGDANQPFIAMDSLSGKTVVIVDVTLSYYDDKGTAYSDKFTLSLAAAGWGSSSGDYATSTPTGVNSAQLVITSYATTVDPLQPGEQFQLGMTVQNMGNTPARRVTMIVGGGSSGGGSEGTPQPGGTSGGSGEFTNFAPVGASNIQSLGDLPAGGAMQVLQNLIVNVSTNPGAYPMKITFSYVNDKGETVNDDQVITLLVYSLPNVDISFYRDPGVVMAGQPNALPIQVVNLGKRSTVLGNMTIATPNGTLEAGSTLVGPIDQGGYFTYDASLIPESSGPLQLTITIEYTDDFNQPRTLTDTLDLTVEEASMEAPLEPSMGGGGGEEIGVSVEETFLQKAWRFVLGLFGLDSAPPGGDIPVEPVPGEEKPVPVRPSGGGKG